MELSLMSEDSWEYRQIQLKMIYQLRDPSSMLVYMILLDHEDIFNEEKKTGGLASLFPQNKLRIRAFSIHMCK